MPEKTFIFQKQQDLLNYCCFPGFVILPVKIHLSSCLALVMIFLLKLLRLKIYFHNPSELGRVLFRTLELIVKEKKKLILHMNLFKAFIFQHGLHLKLFFLKSKAQVMKLICYVTENINKRLKKTLKYRPQ